MVGVNACENLAQNRAQRKDVSARVDFIQLPGGLFRRHVTKRSQNTAVASF